jgi:hypothetical protein
VIAFSIVNAIQHVGVYLLQGQGEDPFKGKEEIGSFHRVSVRPSTITSEVKSPVSLSSDTSQDLAAPGSGSRLIGSGITKPSRRIE